MTKTAARHLAVVAPPLPGHWDPLKVLAGELMRRGHRVTFVHMADAATMVAETGIGFEAVGTASHPAGALAHYRRVLAEAPSRGGFFAMIRATASISDMLLRELPDALRRIGAEAVIADQTEAAGGLAARRLGLPFVTTVTGLPLTREPGVPPPFVRWRYRPGPVGRVRNWGGYAVADLLLRPIRGTIARHARAWNLDPDADGGDSPLLQVAQCPPSLDFPRHRLPLPFRYCGPFRFPPGEAPDLPEDGRPLVYCSLGSLQGDRPELFAAMTRACADLGARAVVAHGGLLDAAAAARLPGEPIVGAYWPQPAVLPRCTAAILHGGFNTVLDALGAGVPMVVAPLAFEQPATAARVAHSGAGVSIGRPSLGRLRTALDTILTQPTYREAAQRMAAELARLGGADRAAGLVDKALRTGRTPP